MPDRNLVSSYLPAVSTGGIEAVVEVYTDRTTEVQRSDRAIVQLTLVLVPLMYGVFGCLLYVVCNADRVRRKQQVELEQMTIENQNARAVAEKANETKSAFLSNMGHEMRTPLTAIIGYAQSILAHDPGGSERAMRLQTIVGNGERLLHVINDVLIAARLEAGKLEVERVSVELLPLLDGLVVHAARAAAEKGIAFDVRYEYPLPERVVTDPVHCREILLNVLDNAVKFTEKGRIDVAVSYVAEKGKLRCAVSDTGIGMTGEQLERLFSAFAQGDGSARRRYGGSGLALHISRELARLLGGDISVTSALGRGSIFEILIDAGEPRPQRFVTEKVQAVPEAGAQRAATIAPPAIAGRILYAEDNVVNQELVKMYVEPTGAELTIVADGKLAVQSALENDYDLVLMDMQMPVMDGMEATTLLRRTGYAGPILALTASSTEDEIELFRQAGCTGFLSKPIDWTLFYAALAQHLPPRRADGAAVKGTAAAPVAGHRLVQAFIAELPGRMHAIRMAHAGANWPALAAAVHDIKGMGGAFGYPRLSDIAALMEAAVKERDFEVLTRLAAELEALASAAVMGVSARAA
jgi:signal transduction histidine kinase/CheY-like chemotaxis protein/HPt (histidine-containing phosphotransfer) domain-containing protein